jgi:hypothetical protein
MGTVTRKILLIVAFLLLAAALIFSVLVIFAPKPPGGELEQAREKIAEARAMKADIYSPDLFATSLQLYDSAMEAWRKENTRFYSSRNYEKAKTLATQAAEAAEKAEKDAASRSVNLKTELMTRIESLNNTIVSIQNMFDFLPLPETVIKENSKGVLLFKEARSAYQKKQYITCLEKIDKSQAYIDRSSEHVMQLLTGYFKNQPEWNKLAESAISRSKKEKCHIIIIDKFARTCMVYYNGKLKNSFMVELGENWIGDKRHMGDKSTPEGSYIIIERLEGSRTKFYKALLINYPNDNDIQRFNHEKKNGMLAESAEIGGLIEIHGEGGKGTDWTDGCIALTNHDMDMLYNVSQKGTSVIIIGSLKPLDEVFSTPNM